MKNIYSTLLKTKMYLFHIYIYTFSRFNPKRLTRGELTIELHRGTLEKTLLFSKVGLFNQSGDKCRRRREVEESASLNSWVFKRFFENGQECPCSGAH